MNEASDERGAAGIDVLWPDVANADYKAALASAKAGLSPNNISCVLRYRLENGPSVIWMGDLETDFMEKVQGGYRATIDPYRSCTSPWSRQDSCQMVGSTRPGRHRVRTRAKRVPSVLPWSEHNHAEQRPRHCVRMRDRDS